MSKTRKIIVGGTVGLAVAVALSLLCILLLPHFISLGPVRQKIIAAISESIGGRFEYERADLSFFPRPRVVIQKPRVSIPEKATISLEALTIVPQIIPLLHGRIRVSTVSFQSPNAAVEIPAGSADGEQSPGFPFPDIQGQLAPLLKRLEGEIPQLAVHVERGRLNLQVNGRPILWFDNIQGSIHFPPDQLRIDLSCSSNLWRNISIAARVSSRDLNGTADIEAADLHPRDLLNYLASATVPGLGGVRGDLKISLAVERGMTIKGLIQASSDSLSLQRGEKKWTLTGIRANGDFQIAGGKAALSLTELSVESPRARLQGKVAVDTSVAHYALEIAAREIEVVPVREIATGIAGDTEPIRTIFDIVRSGSVSSISIKSTGASPQDLGRLKNISMEGSLAGGGIFLSESLTGLKGIDFDLREVQGIVLVTRGILEGQGLSARWDKAAVSQGVLKLGLEGGNAPFHLEAVAEADIAWLSPFLKKIIGNENFSREMDRFRLQGSARGKVILGESLKSIQPRVEIQAMNLTARPDRIPFPLQVEDVRGVYYRGKIDVQNLRGKIGQSSFQEVSAQINAASVPYISVSSGKCSIVADEMFAWATTFEGFKDRLPGFQSLTGSIAVSSLSINGPLGRLEEWDYRIQAEIGDLVARHEPVPYPIQIQSAQVSLDTKKVSFENLNGKLGASVFSGIAAQIDWGEIPFIAVPSGSALLELGEIHSWLTSIGRFETVLRDLKTLQGRVAVSAIDLKGPLLRPEKWKYRIAGEIREVLTETSLLPGPLSVSAAKFEADPEKILLRDCRANLLDASLRLSAEWREWRRGSGGMAASFDADAGPRLMEWASARFRFPPYLRIRAPLSVSQGRLGWDRDKGISFQGHCAWPGGAGASIDLLYTPEAIVIHRLLVSANGSRVEIGMEFRKRELRLDFRGILEKSTVDQILVGNDFLADSIRGDFQSRLFIDEPLRSTAEGKVAASGLHLTLPVGIPLIVHNFSLDADRRKIRIQSASLTCEEHHLTLDGTVDFLPEGFLLDLNVSTDGLRWDKIEKLLKTENEKKATGEIEKGSEATKPGETPFPPVRGRIGIRSVSFTYDKYTWKPLDLEITFPPDGVAIAVREANLCGASTTGVVSVTPGGEIALDFNPVAKRQEFASTWQCLKGDASTIFGRFDFNGRIKARAPAEELVRSLRGPWQLDAKDGRVYHGSLVIDILAFLSLPELFAKDRSDLSKREISYKTFRAKGEMESGKVLIEELAMNSPEMTLISQGEIDVVKRRVDLVVAVAPLTTVDWVLKKIPILGYILGGTLVSIPVKVTGDLDNPSIIPLDPAEIGMGFVGMMKRTLNVPFKLIKPIIREFE
ncbi:MAG TPA: AsmA-like C-terminal domain-containing protein [Thermodesulfobacteriota bacterium]|nr:AsmA-like C-terminal domain-containing protein [Thermodesulfobacteriota bacterium]